MGPHRHTFRALAILTVLVMSGIATAQDVEQPPDYLQPLLKSVMESDDDGFFVAYTRVRERLERNLYIDSDKMFLTRAFVRRAQTDPELRPEIITLIGQIGSPESVPVLMDYVRNGDETERLHAIQALGWVGDPAANEVLVPLRGTEDEQVAWMLDYALKAIRVKQDIGEAVANPSGRPDARYEIISRTLLEEPNWLVRADIARMLSAWPDERVWPLLFDAHSKWDAPQPYSDRLSAILTQRYEYDPSGFMRALRERGTADKVFGLTAIEDIAASEHLSDLMDIAESESDEAVRTHAVRALGRLLSR